MSTMSNVKMSKCQLSKSQNVVICTDLLRSDQICRDLLRSVEISPDMSRSPQTNQDLPRSTKMSIKLSKCHNIKCHVFQSV